MTLQAVLLQVKMCLRYGTKVSLREMLFQFLQLQKLQLQESRQQAVSTVFLQRVLQVLV